MQVVMTMEEWQEFSDKLKAANDLNKEYAEAIENLTDEVLSLKDRNRALRDDLGIEDGCPSTQPSAR